MAPPGPAQGNIRLPTARCPVAPLSTRHGRLTNLHHNTSYPPRTKASALANPTSRLRLLSRKPLLLPCLAIRSAPCASHIQIKEAAMVRGGSSGGGQSSLGYLFTAPKAAAKGPAAKEPAAEAQPAPAAPAEQRAAGFARGNVAEEKGAPAAKVEEAKSSVENAPKLGRSSNNYHRADGQNTGNFITDRPSTKVHTVPGGQSSLGYLFGGNNVCK